MWFPLDKSNFSWPVNSNIDVPKQIEKFHAITNFFPLKNFSILLVSWIWELLRIIFNHVVFNTKEKTLNFLKASLEESGGDVIFGLSLKTCSVILKLFLENKTHIKVTSKKQENFAMPFSSTPKMNRPTYTQISGELHSSKTFVLFLIELKTFKNLCLKIKY